MVGSLRVSHGQDAPDPCHPCSATRGGLEDQQGWGEDLSGDLGIENGPIGQETQLLSPALCDLGQGPGPLCVSFHCPESGMNLPPSFPTPRAQERAGWGAGAGEAHPGGGGVWGVE